jgi:hypothetical protein
LLEKLANATSQSVSLTRHIYESLKEWQRTTLTPSLLATHMVDKFACLGLAVQKR